MPIQPPSQEQSISTILLRGFMGGIANAISILFTNPLDVLKIRFQTSQQNTSTVLRTQSTFHKAVAIVRVEGFRGLYKGLSISLVREITFSSGRVGLYEPCKEILTPAGQTHIGGSRKLLAGLISGAVAAAICNPTDVIKIRFQGDSAPKHGGKPRYSSIYQAVQDIIKNEGVVGGLYKGVLTTTTRSAVLSGTQLASYDTFKHNLLLHYFPHLWTSDSFSLHFCSSFFAGVATTLTSNPLDITRTRIMNEKVVKIFENGKWVTKSQYSTNPIVTMFLIARREGPMALYKGFVPSYVRLGSCTVIFFIVYEKLRNLIGIRGF